MVSFYLKLFLDKKKIVIRIQWILFPVGFESFSSKVGGNIWQSHN